MAAIAAVNPVLSDLQIRRLLYNPQVERECRCRLMVFCGQPGYGIRFCCPALEVKPG